MSPTNNKRLSSRIHGVPPSSNTHKLVSAQAITATPSTPLPFSPPQPSPSAQDVSRETGGQTQPPSTHAPPTVNPKGSGLLPRSGDAHMHLVLPPPKNKRQVQVLEKQETPLLSSSCHHHLLNVLPSVDVPLNDHIPNAPPSSKHNNNNNTNGDNATRPPPLHNNNYITNNRGPTSLTPPNTNNTSQPPTLYNNNNDKNGNTTLPQPALDHSNNKNNIPPPCH